MGGMTRNRRGDAFNAAQPEAKAGYEIESAGRRFPRSPYQTDCSLDVSKPDPRGRKRSRTSIYRRRKPMRCKNMWTLGLMYWLFGRENAESTVEWLKNKFAKRPEDRRGQHRRPQRRAHLW